MNKSTIGNIGLGIVSLGLIAGIITINLAIPQTPEYPEDILVVNGRQCTMTHWEDIQLSTDSGIFAWVETENGINYQYQKKIVIPDHNPTPIN